MDNDILKRKEKGYRRKHSGDTFEKMYTYYRQKFAQSEPDGKETYLPPLYRDLFGEPSGIGALKTPIAESPVIKTPQIPLKPQKIENKFYTNTENSGIIPNMPSIGDYRQSIDVLNKKIADLNKGQYKAMLSGNKVKTNAYDPLIADSEKVLSKLKASLADAMGIGSENKDKDMLRPIGERIRKKPLFAANNTQKAIVIDDMDEQYPPEPSPSPVPEPPPVEDWHPDMEKYEEEVGNYWDAHDAWKGEAARMDSAKAADDYSDVEKEKVSPDPLKDDHIYVSEKEYNSLLEDLDQELKNRYTSDGPVPNPIDIQMKKTTLYQNRESSKSAEEVNGTYNTEADAAVAFAEKEVPQTGNDYLERGAIIIGTEVPIVTEDGHIVMQTRYRLGETFMGNHSDVVGGTLSAYAGAVPEMINKGANISFVHTHPYCTGHVANDFSGLEGNTVFDIAGEAIKKLVNNEKFDDFGYYLGDKQVAWLPGVDKIYLASPTDNKLYACDDNGPILDPNDPEKAYKEFGHYNAIITNQLQD